MIIEVYLALLGNDYDYLCLTIEGEEAIKRFVENNPHSRISQLNDKIFLADKIKALFDNSKKTTRYYRKADLLLPLLEPVQQELGNIILVSPLIATPEKMKKLFQENPMAVLEKVRSTSIAETYKNEDWIPIIFNDFGVRKIGFQHRMRILKSMDCMFTFDPKTMEAFEQSTKLVHVFPNVLFWEDWLGLKQYYGDFKVYNDSFDFAGIQASTNELKEISLPYNDIKSITGGLVSLTITTNKNVEHKFSMSSFRTNGWKLLNFLRKVVAQRRRSK